MMQKLRRERSVFDELCNAPQFGEIKLKNLYPNWSPCDICFKTHIGDFENPTVLNDHSTCKSDQTELSSQTLPLTCHLLSPLAFCTTSQELTTSNIFPLIFLCVLFSFVLFSPMSSAQKSLLSLFHFFLCFLCLNTVTVC